MTACAAAAVLASAGASAAVPVKAFKAPADGGCPIMKAASVNPSVKCDTIVFENFSKWTAGSPDAPSSEMVTEAETADLMSYPGDWTLFRMYEAGGAGFMGFDNIGDDGPGYIKTPGINLLADNEKEGIFRFSCRVMNVNENATEQGLQAFILDEEASMINTASTLPMKYKEWTECSWIGTAQSPSFSFMTFGWQGNVLIDRLVVEKLIYPLASPVVKSAELDDETGFVTLTWNKVEEATSYTVEVYETFGKEPLLSVEVGDVDTCTLDFNGMTFEENFIFHVTARDGEMVSYPGTLAEAFMPDAVGTPTVLPATNVTASGFTANWESAVLAANYLVLPQVRHTAREAETYYILNENFSNVPEDADEFKAIMIAPIMNYNGMDIYWSRAGWTADMGMMVRLMPQLPVFALTNQYASMGLEGALTSPATDFSVGGGKVSVQGMGISSEDDIVLACQLVDADGKAYASEEFELTTDGALFDVNLEGGRADSRLVIKIVDSCEGGDAAIFTNIAVSVDLESGESITVPAETVRAYGRATSAEVECTVDDDNIYTYAVRGYINDMLLGDASQYVAVNEGSAVKALADKDAQAFIAGGVLCVANPAGENCAVYTLDGKLVKAFSAKALAVDVAKGVYIVKVGNKSFKVAY